MKLRPIDAARQRVAGAYSPEALEQAGKAIAASLSDFYRASQSGNPHAHSTPRPLDVINSMTTALEAKPFGGAESIAAVLEPFLKDAMRLHSPHYMGHQVPAPIPLAGLVQGLVGVANQGTAVFEMGPTSIGAEKALIQALLPLLEWDKKSPVLAKLDGDDPADAILTNGGTLANLTALLTARNVRYADAWAEGLSSQKRKPTVITSADSHYSVSRAGGIMGIGATNILKSPLDHKRRLSPEGLRESIKTAQGEGRDVFAIVATAGSTPVGAFDDLTAIGAIAQEFGIWLHVDAAHGGGVLLSKQHRHLLAGIKQADSVTWDAHKMMFMPSLSTFLFYRRKRDSFKTFTQDAPYLLDSDDGEKMGRDAGLRTLECTRQAMVLSLWSTWRAYGPTLFEDLVDIAFANTKDFYDMIEASADFEALHVPEANILCFRYAAKSKKAALPEGELDALQHKLRHALNSSGEFYITGTTLSGRPCLRVTMMNPMIDKSHLSDLLDALRAQAKGL